MRQERILHSFLVTTAVLIIVAACTAPARAARLCFCSKADAAKGIAIQRCGELKAYNARPGGAYEIDEEGGRGTIALSADNYMECEQPKECPAQVLPAERPPLPACVSASATSTAAEAFGIYGSNTIGEKLLPRLIAEYAKKLGWKAADSRCDGDIRLNDWKTPSQTALTIECRARGTETGIPALVEEKADVAMLSRPITENEIEKMRRSGFPGMTTSLHEHVLALDGLSAVVSTRNTAGALSLEQIADIFAQSANARSWSQFRAGSGDIRLYLRDENSGTREMFNTLVMAPRGKSLPPCNRPNVRCYASSSELIRDVADDPQGIGFVGYAYQNGVRAVPIAGQCGLRQTPSRFNIKTEDYLLSRRLFLYTAKVHSIHSPNFIFFALSEGAQAAIEDTGYVDQRIEKEATQDTADRIRRYEAEPPREAGLETDPALMRKLRDETKGATRLSISFRFRYNSTTLDTKALQDINRLAEYLTFQAPRGRIALLGFTDSAGDVRSNMQLSLDRAKAIENALLSAGIPADRIAARGYSELIPVACNNDSAEGRSKNRRVEVWQLPE